MAVDISNIKSKKKESSKSEESSILEFLNKDISLFGNQLSDKKRERFYTELSILLEAGVDIRSALELIIEEQKTEKDKILFRQILKEVVAGDSLSECIRRTGKFSDHEYYNLQIGEETGKLPYILSELGVFYQKKLKQKRQFTTAMSYPVLVLSTASGAIVFMFTFIVPMFADVFNRFGGELPAITQWIINVSNWFSKYIGLLFIIFISFIVFIYSQKKKNWLRDISSIVALRLPIFGGLISKIFLARFCQGMQLMTSSKIPLLKAINLSQKMIGFYPIEQALVSIEQDILQGEQLHKSMAKFSVFNKRLVSLIKVGEEVNQLDSFFDKIAKQYSEEVEHQTSLLSSLIEPLLIIFLGIIVGVVLVSMYLPMFQMSSSFGG